MVNDDIDDTASGDNSDGEDLRAAVQGARLKGLYQGKVTGAVTLAGSDFSSVLAPRPQTCLIVFGPAGSGKTTLAAQYAPDPVAFINYDKRADHAIVHAQAKGRRILYTHVGIPSNVIHMADDVAKKAGQLAVDKTLRNFEIAVRESQKGNVRTIVLDTGSEYNEILKLAVTGRLDRAKGDYGRSKDVLNQQWWRLFNAAREGKAHLIVLARAQEIWLGNEPTGNFKARGPEVMYDAADFAAHIRLRRGAKGKLRPEFEIEVTKAGINVAELGAVYKESDWQELGGPFAYACSMQYPGTDPSDWV